MVQAMRNIWNIKWNTLLSVLVAFAFMLSVSSLAGANPRSASIMPQVEMGVHSSVQADATSKQDFDQVALHKDCCEDDGDVPCSDSNGCKTVCPGFSLSSAVLGSAHDLRCFSKASNLVFSQLSYEETSLQLNAPPPRV